VYIFEIQNGRFSPIDEAQTVTITETTAEVTVTLEQIVGYIAQNGAKQAALGILTDSSEVKRINLEAARSRITDTDVAVEMQNLSKAKILSQIGALSVKQSVDSQKAILQIIDDLRS
jgi:flagellin